MNTDVERNMHHSFRFHTITFTAAAVSQITEEKIQWKCAGSEKQPQKWLMYLFKYNSGLNYLSLSYAKHWNICTFEEVIQHGIVSSMLWHYERGIQFPSLLDNTQKHGLLSTLLSALAWLNVTDNCLLSHNTSWDHGRGTGFPPWGSQKNRGGVWSNGMRIRCAAARWNLPLVGDGGLQPISGLGKQDSWRWAWNAQCSGVCLFYSTFKPERECASEKKLINLRKK